MLTIRTHASLAEIPAGSWDALHDGGNPFVTHAFLGGLETHGCLRPLWGWTPLHAALWDGDELVAAAPSYLKGNSHGEFVFDHAWAHAYAQRGIDYYPKWLFAVPYTPVTGPRLLAKTPAHRAALCVAIEEHARRMRLSSLHLNFLGADENADCPDRWAERRDLQFHWRNDAGWRDFGDFMAALTHKKRKNIRHEREQVRCAGWRFRVVHGDEAGEDELAAMHGYYYRTFAEYGNSPALTLDFLRHLAHTMPRALVLILAIRNGRIAAGALCLRGGDTLYGRYWGADELTPGLHFETCYYQGIDYCLRQGLRVFEPGAQGEHKIARGFLPVVTRSRHWLADPVFREVIARWCLEERRAAADYHAAAMRHSPFRHGCLDAAVADPRA